MSHYPTLYLLNVEQLPHNRNDMYQATTTSISQALAICTSLASHSSVAEVLTSVSEARNMIPIEIKPAISVNQDQALAMERPEEHDSFFNIVRVDGDAFHVLVYSTLQSYSELLEDALTEGTSLDLWEWSRLRVAFDAMIHYISHKPVQPLVNVSYHLPTKNSYSCEQRDPLHRWRIGHHVFITLIQDLVVAFGCFSGAITSDDLSEAEVALELATILMWGSASALRFAGDFHPQQYETLVRPAMMPPNLEPGFSGLQSRDHYYLIKSLSRLKSVFKRLDPCFQSQYYQFLQAFDAAYEAHKLVCSRFKGDQQPSLRMQAEVRHTAIDVIDQLKHARMRNLLL